MGANSAFGNGTEHPASAQGPASRAIGSVKSIQDKAVALVTDSGAEVHVVVQEATRLLRTEPGQTDLKEATPISLQDIQPGDRILVRGKVSEDGHSLVAALVIAIKRGDIEQKRAREQEDWQKRGLGGLVNAVDIASQSITITTSRLAGSKPVAVRVAQGTVFRRYAPDSVRFEDARPSRLEEIKPGDQLRARGTRSADGSEFSAEEIVTGSFRNIAGTISKVDSGANTLTVADLMTKKPVVVQITADASLRKLPPLMAEGIAMRLKGPPAGAAAAGWRGPGASAGGPRGEVPGAGSPGNRSPSFQQLLSRVPPARLADFAKGEAVMIVSTQGKDPGEVTAIMLVGGVEPILQASPEGSEPMTLSPWSLGESGPEATGL